MAQGNPASYSLSIDWAGVGSFPDNGDTAKLRTFRIDRGRDQTFSGDVASNETKLARARIGHLDMTLDNEDGRYDAYNTAGVVYNLSPVGFKVSPGKVVRLRVTDDLGTTYTLFTGIVDDIRTQGYRHDAKVVISCSDAWKILSQKPQPTKLYTLGFSGTPMVEILAAAGVLKNIALGGNTYSFIWGENEIPYQVLHDLTEMEGGYCHVDTTNTFNYVTRSVAENETPSFTLTQAQILNEPMVTQPWDNLKNEVTMTLHNRTPAVTIGSTNPPVVWSTSDTPILRAGESVSYLITFSGINGKVPAIAPFFYGRIFAANANGTGTNLDAFLSISVFTPVGSAVRYGVTYKNIGTQTGYLSSLTLGGNPLNDLYPTEITVKDVTSIGLYGTRTLRLDYIYMQGAINAGFAAASYLARFKDPRAIFTVQLVNRSTQQFAYELNTLMDFNSAVLSTTNYKSIVHPSANASNVAVGGGAPTRITNAGFELGTIEGFDSFNQTYDVSIVHVHSGIYALRGKSAGGGMGLTPWFFRSLGVPISPGTSFAVSAWFYWDFASNPSQDIVVEWYSDPATVASAVAITGTITGQTWTQVSGTVTAPAGTTSYKLRIALGSTTVSTYLDDVIGLGDTGVGIDKSWHNPTNAELQDGVATYCNTTVTDTTQYPSDILWLQGFLYALQLTDTPQGISVRIRKKTIVSPAGKPGYPGGTLDYSVKIIKGGVVSGTEHAKAAVWSTSYEDSIYGGLNDLWGLVLTPADVNDGTFGLAIQVTNGLTQPDIGWAQANIDYVEMTVYTANGSFPNAFRIIGIKHETGETPFEVTTTWVLEPTANSSGQLSPSQAVTTPVAGELFPMVGGVTY